MACGDRNTGVRKTSAISASHFLRYSLLPKERIPRTPMWVHPTHQQQALHRRLALLPRLGSPVFCARGQAGVVVASTGVLVSLSHRYRLV